MTCVERWELGHMSCIEAGKMDRCHARRLADALLLDSKDLKKLPFPPQILFFLKKSSLLNFQPLSENTFLNICKLTPVLLLLINCL